MKKFLVILTAFILTTSLSLPVFAKPSASPAQNDKKIEVRKIELTENQKKEVHEIMSKMNDLRKQLVDKYQSYGIVTKEQADEIKSRLDKKMNMMREKGIVPGVYGKKDGKFKGKERQKQVDQ